MCVCVFWEKGSQAVEFHAASHSTFQNEGISFSVRHGKSAAKFLMRRLVIKVIVARTHEVR